MSKRIKSMILLLWRLHQSGFIAFWLIFTGVYLLLLLWGAFRQEVFPSEGAMLIGGLGALFLYLFYIGFFTIRMSFAAAPEINANRDEYYLAVLFFYFILAGLVALIQTAAYELLEVGLAQSLNYIGEIYYFSFNGMNMHSFFEAFVIHFITALFVITVSHGIGTFYYHWGKLFLFPVLAAAVYGLTQTNLDWWIGLFMIERFSSLGFYVLELTAASGVALLLGWLALRGAPVKK
jgi:hypothetical protein